MAKSKKVTEMENFLEELQYYQHLRILYNRGELKKSTAAEIQPLRTKLLREVGAFSSLITELTGKEKIQIVGKGTEYAYDMWAAALRIEFNKTTLDALRICIDYTDRAIGKLKSAINEGIRDKQGNIIGKPTKDAAESPVNLFDKMQLHPRVIEVSESLFKTGNYASAILEAFKAVDNYVKEKTTLSLNGQALMSKVFDENAPIIKLNDLLTQSDRDEQEGFKFLFKGATIGIRNPKAHDNVVQTDPYRTLEYLGLASLLMRRIEEGKLVKLLK